jgi:hypothetical protein
MNAFVEYTDTVFSNSDILGDLKQEARVLNWLVKKKSKSLGKSKSPPGRHQSSKMASS